MAWDLTANIRGPEGPPGADGGGDGDIAFQYATLRADSNDKARIANERALQINQHLNAAELNVDWSSLTGWQATGVSVSGGRLVGGSGAKALKSFTFDWADTTKVARVVVTGRRPSGITASSLFLAIDLGTADHAPGVGDKYIGIGLDNLGNRSSFYSGMGATVFEYEVNESVATAGTYGAAPSGTADYTMSVDIGPENVSFCIVDTGFPETGMVVLTIKRSVLAAAATSNTYFNIMLGAMQSAGTAQSFGPLAAFNTLEKSRNPVYSALDFTSRWVVPKYNTPATSAEVWAYQLPRNYDPLLGAPLVVFFHQSFSGEWDELWDESQPNQVPKVAEDLVAAGYIVACCSDSGDRWGNAASIANYLALYQYITKYHNVTEVFYWASSMGGGAVLNALQHPELGMPTPRACAFVAGLIDYRDIWTRHLKSDSGYTTHKASFKAAYGMTSDVETDPGGFNAKTLGYRPEDAEGYKYRGVAMKYWYGGTGLNKDDVVEIGDGTHANVDDLFAATAPYSPENSLVITDGPHGSTDSYRDTETVAFFNSYRKGYSDDSQLGLALKSMQALITANTAAIAANTSGISANTTAINRRNTLVIKQGTSLADRTVTTADPVNIMCDPNGADWTLILPSVGAGYEYLLRFAPNVDDTTHVITVSGLFVVRGGSTTVSGLKLFAYNQILRVMSTAVPGSWRVIEASEAIAVPNTTHSTDIDEVPYGTQVGYY